MGPIIFVHGAGLNSEFWQYQTSYFADAGAVDLPGHGASTTSALSSVSSYADWLSRHIRSDQPGPITLVGHSMGSLVALETAALNPDMVSGLVLIAPAAEMLVHPDLLAAARNHDAAAAAMVIKWSLPKTSGYGRPRDWVVRMTDDFITAAENGVMASDLTACNDYEDAVKMAERVRCPALLIVGENDTMTRPAAAQPLVSALVDARIIVIEKTGHMLPMEKPDEVNEAISLFLTTN